MKTKTEETALDRAIRILGSQRAVGMVCGKKQQHVWDWRWRSGGRVPPASAVKIELAVDATLGMDRRVTRRELCPDFPWDEALES